ncbi:MAG TPA: sulfotransferase family protein, partial [Cyanobacteria bacterium UBA12227]|nr:sulfotransferase family protein [Cyanobacteria bacterium UBA12227]
IQEFAQSLGHKRVVQRIVYKEPFLSFAPEFAYHSLPNCRILHIYRDGRDCADSLVRTYNILTDEKLIDLRTSEMPLGRKYGNRYVPWWVENGREEEFLECTPYVRAIWMWKEMVSHCHKFFSLPDVIASGRTMVLKYEDLVNHPLKYGQSVVEHFGSQMNTRLQKRFNQARTSSIGSYKRRDSQEIELAEKIAHKELEIYGYI